MFRLFNIIIFILAYHSMALATPEAVSLHIKVDNTPARAGYYQLKWINPENHAIELQEATNADFHNARTLWRGVAQSRFMSGKSNGDYFYRLRFVHDHAPGAWGPATKVQVAHHSLRQAGMWFALGLSVFVLILVAIWHGQARES